MSVMDNANIELSRNSGRNYPKEQLQRLYDMRERDQLCDVTIHVGGRKFRAHKTVLAATGDYFLTMFTSGFRESSAQEITIEGSPAAFEILLNFVYTGRVDHTGVSSCMVEVLEMACYMQFTAFVNMCSAAVQILLGATTESVSLSDACKVMLLAKTHDLTAVYQATLGYLEDKVESLKALDVFLAIMSATCLQDLLCHEYLSNADEEDQVLELVTNWLKHDWEKRKEYSHQLLQKVRLGLVSSEDIKKLIGPEILDIPGCSELVNRALDLHASNKPKVILAIENPDLAAARSTVMAPVILRYGKLNYYDVKEEDWITMNEMDPLPSKSMAKNIYELIVVKGILYAAGGIDGREFLKYEASANKWAPLPSKPLGKIRIKLVALGAYIYAFGACCSPKDQVIERYDISAKKWEVLKQQGYGRPLLAEVMDADGNTGRCKCSADEDNGRREISAVVFEGKIMVSGFYQEIDWENDTYSGHWGEPLLCHLLDGELVVFDPVLNTYQIEDFGGWDNEDEYRQWDNICFKPTLFVYEDQLHLMMTEFKGCESPESPVTVYKLCVTQDDGKITVDYDDIQCKTPVKTVAEEDAPFYVQDNIFVKQSRSSKAGHSKVKSFPQYGENKKLMYVHAFDLLYPVWFSFEKKLTV